MTLLRSIKYRGKDRGTKDVSQSIHNAEVVRNAAPADEGACNILPFYAETLIMRPVLSTTPPAC
ncbi:hypothetical protein J6590_075780 [Homalodisca vitripennis]|nr:hypothetical protein J6590_075780 [Homalodisca vitripennis]